MQFLAFNKKKSHQLKKGNLTPQCIMTQNGQYTSQKSCKILQVLLDFQTISDYSGTLSIKGSQLNPWTFGKN